MPRWKRAPAPCLGLDGGKKAFLIPNVYYLWFRRCLIFTGFFLVSVTFYPVPEGSLTVRELLRGRPCFWADFSPKWIRRSVTLYRSRFQTNLPTEGGSESSMDGFIPYVPWTKRDRSKPRKDKHLMVDEDVVDGKLSPDNLLKDYLDSQVGGSSSEQFNLDGLFEFDFTPTEGGSNEVPDFSKAARMVNGGLLMINRALDTSKQEAQMTRFKAEVAEKEIARLKDELESSRRRERESFEKEVNHAYKRGKREIVEVMKSCCDTFSQKFGELKGRYKTENMAEKDKDLKIPEVEEEIWEQWEPVPVSLDTVEAETGDLGEAGEVLKMEDMYFGRTLIGGITTTWSDMSMETSVDATLQTSIDESTETSIDESTETSIDDTPPEAGKFSLTNHANDEVVLDEQNQFGINQIDDDVLSDLEQLVDFVDIPTLKDWYPNSDTDSFTRNYDATVGSRRGREKFRLNQAFRGNRKMATDLNGKINIIYSELMRKFDALSEHIKRLDSQVAENATTIKRETGRLPGRTDANLKRQVNVVLLRSGKRLTTSTIEINFDENPGVVEKTGESRSQPILLDNPDLGSEPSREMERSMWEPKFAPSISVELGKRNKSEFDAISGDELRRRGEDRFRSIQLGRSPNWTGPARRTTKLNPRLIQLGRSPNWTGPARRMA
ncbi:hypothetical protein DY000_02016617 [Brassica cretica]|uniref:Uncharacterized protein n=1 Tax=Brassica cretica TaxID=69181 RepID=A0ABQ7D1A2_BRACR|nr:hypothetical protein DY000_02016617 [Brassica cretica]